MTTHEWSAQWRRLMNQFRLSADVKPADLSSEWFSQLKHYHVDAVEAGITLLLRDARDTFFPALGLLLEKISTRLKSMNRTKAKCETCGGNTWIDSWPYWSNGHVYTCVIRCPDCGVPAPQVKTDGHQQPLTAAEYQSWKAGTLQQPDIYVARNKHAVGKGHGMEKFQPPELPKKDVAS